MKNFLVLYACIVDDEEAGIFVDYPYFGGMVDTLEQVELLQKSLINDRHIPGSKFTKYYSSELVSSVRECIDLAKRQFGKMARDMYEVEDMQERMKRK